MKPIVYVDMDNVIVDFATGIAKLDSATLEQYQGRLDEVPGIFSMMEPLADAIKSLEQLAEKYNLYILSTAPWHNPSAWIHKLEWVHKYFGKEEGSLFYKKLIISHNKHLNAGHFLIDDRPNNGAKDFTGQWIHFGSESFPDWQSVTTYLLAQ